MKICSVLIPTRKRVGRLLKSIESIKATSSEDNVEICLRVDSDDIQTLSDLPCILSSHKNVRVIIGPRLGYGRLHDYYNELCRIVESDWFIVLNDDITIEGEGWDERLRQIPMSRLAIPEFYKLGGSGYTDFGCAYVCPIVPIGEFWKHGQMGPPVDVWWMERLGGGMESKSNTTAVVGLCVNHQRDDYHAIEAHRND